MPKRRPRKAVNYSALGPAIEDPPRRVTDAQMRELWQLTPQQREIFRALIRGRQASYQNFESALEMAQQAAPVELEYFAPAALHLEPPTAQSALSWEVS